MQNDDPTVYDNSDIAEYKAELDAIASDPTLSPEEKIDAAGQAVQDEFDEISAATEITADPAALSGDTGTTSTESAATEVDSAATTSGAEHAAASTQSAQSAQSAGSTEVTGDPSTATYGDSPTAAPAPAPAPPTPASEPATATDTQTAGAAGAPSTVNDAIGVNGTVDYLSPRDVDGDGIVDLTHSRVDGIDTITHYDEDGSISLVEQDTDVNGTYETTASLQSDGSIRVAEDLDDDGTVDLATFLDPNTGAPIRMDAIENGRITETLLDTDLDGQPATRLLDTDGDGRFDTAIVDTDADGYTNATLVDTDRDGRFDLASIDADNTDGIAETVVTGTEAELGGIEDFEAAIPAADSYHAQAGTYPGTQHSDTDL